MLTRISKRKIVAFTTQPKRLQEILRGVPPAVMSREHGLRRLSMCDPRGNGSERPNTVREVTR